MASKPYPDKKRGVWRMKHRPDPTGPWKTATLGKDERLKRGTPPKKPPPDIEAMANRLADEEYRASLNFAPSPARPQMIDEYIDAYTKMFGAAKASGSLVLLRRYSDAFKAWCREMDIRTVQGLAKVHCKRYLEHRLTIVAPSTLKTERGYLAAIWSQAMDEEIITINPWRAAKIEAPTKPTKKPQFWTTEEIDRIADACQTDWHRDLVWTLVNTGIRVSGALAMEWDWIDRRQSLIHVPAAHNKGKFAYSTILMDKTREVLDQREGKLGKTSRFVFPSSEEDSRPCGYDSAKVAFERAVRNADVPGGTLHDLRHTFGRRLHLAGVPQAVISALLGHASMATTEIYTRMTIKDVMAFMKNLKGGLDGLGKPEPSA